LPANQSLRLMRKDAGQFGFSVEDR